MMKRQSVRWLGNAAAAGVLTLVMAAPAVQAQSLNDQRRGGDDSRSSQGAYRDQAGTRGQGQGEYRGQPDTQSQGQYDRGRSDNNRGDERSTGSSYRDNQRVSVQGRVSSFTRDRDGYRVQLDSGRDSYWIPQSYLRSGAHNLRVGISVVLGGVFRGGSINVDAVNWPDDRGYGGSYNDRYVAGVVERVDYRSGTMLLRDDHSGRMITADMAGYNRRMDNIRRGDYVELSGDWTRGGVFDIARIENVRTRN